MTLLEALAKKSEAPIEIISGVAVGRKFRWHRGHIQTQTATSEFWNDCTNISALILARADKVKIKGNDMVEKLNYGWQAGGGYIEPTRECVCDKINEIIDNLHELKALYKEYDKLLPAAIESINVHERQIDKLQMMLEPHKCEPRPENVQDKFAEQRKWVGCVCRFWYDNPDDFLLDTLGKIQTGKDGIEYYAEECYDWYPHCEPVKPDDPIIYKGDDK